MPWNGPSPPRVSVDPRAAGNIDRGGKKLHFASFRNCSQVDTLVKLEVQHGARADLT